MRLSIELSPEQHYQIKAMAALQGKTIKELVLGRIFGEAKGDADAWEDFKVFMKERINEAKESEPTTGSFMEIFQERIQEKNAK